MVNKSIIQGIKYKYITNPKTGRRVLIRGKIGKKILKNYYNYYKNAGIQLGGNKYSYVINPRTGRRVSLHGRYGQKILSQLGGESYWSKFKKYSKKKAKKAYKFAKDHKKEIAGVALAAAGLGAAYAGKKHYDKKHKFTSGTLPAGNPPRTPPAGNPPRTPPAGNPKTKSTEIVGIHNYGNTCYLNSLIQNLNNLPVFKEELEKRNNLTTKDSERKRHLKDFIEIMNWISNPKDIMHNSGYSYIIPGNSDMNIRTSYWAKYYRNEKFKDWKDKDGNPKWNGQFDPGEFLAHLLDILGCLSATDNYDYLFQKDEFEQNMGSDFFKQRILFGFYEQKFNILNNRKFDIRFNYQPIINIAVNALGNPEHPLSKEKNLLRLITNSENFGTQTFEELIIISKHLKNPENITEDWENKLKIIGNNCTCTKKTLNNNGVEKKITDYKLKENDYKIQQDNSIIKIQYNFVKCLPNILKKKTSINRPLGKYVLINLQRGGQNPLTLQMEFDKKKINIEEVLEIPIGDGQSQKLNLKGVCLKYGSPEGGHWVAYIKNNSGKWFLCNDKVVTQMDNFKACHDHSDYPISENGVLFFYTKEDNITEHLDSSNLRTNVFTTAKQMSDSGYKILLKEELSKAAKQSDYSFDLNSKNSNKEKEVPKEKNIDETKPINESVNIQQTVETSISNPINEDASKTELPKIVQTEPGQSSKNVEIPNTGVVTEQGIFPKNNPVETKPAPVSKPAPVEPAQTPGVQAPVETKPAPVSKPAPVKPALEFSQQSSENKKMVKIPGLSIPIHPGTLKVLQK